MFVDEKIDNEAIRWATNEGATLRLLPGEHRIVFRKNGKTIYDETIEVKNPSEGTTYVAINDLMLADPEGTLCLQIPKLAENRNNLELLVDGNLDRDAVRWAGNEASSRLLPGEHRITFRKNGITIHDEKVVVKDQSEGTTFLAIDLKVTGTVVITSLIPPLAKEVVDVKVDERTVKQWQPLANEVEITVEVGTHIIEVSLRQPQARILRHGFVS